MKVFTSLVLLKKSLSEKGCTCASTEKHLQDTNHHTAVEEEKYIILLINVVSWIKMWLLIFI